MKRLVLLLSITLILGGCNVIKIFKVFNKGAIRQQNFTEKVPFTFDGLIKVKVSIHGKMYPFVFDTGAQISVISESVAKELGLSAYSKMSIEDSQDAEHEQIFYKIDSMKMANVVFTNQAFVGADFSKMNCFGKEEFVGILGSGFMRKAVWFIDNETNTLTLTSSRSNLKPLKNEQVIPFTTSAFNHCPVFVMNIDGLVDKKAVEFDMGSSGAIRLTTKLISNPKKHKTNFTVGSAYRGLFGVAKTDTTFRVFAKKVEMGKIALDSAQLVQFAKSGSSIVGMAVLRNYNIILDWNKKEIALDKISAQAVARVSKGFSIRFEENAFVVVEILNNSDAQRQGLRLGDKIIAVGNDNYKDKLAGDPCKTVSDFNVSKPQPLLLTVEREGRAMSFQINPTKL